MSICLFFIAHRRLKKNSPRKYETVWHVQLPLCCTASKKLCQQRFHSKLPDTNPDTILSTSASFVKNFVQKIAYIHCAQNQSGSLIMAPVESSVSIMKYCSTQQCNCPVSYYWPNTEHTVRKPRTFKY